MVVAATILLCWIGVHEGWWVSSGDRARDPNDSAQQDHAKTVQPQVVRDRLEKAVTNLEASKDPANSRLILAELRRLLDSLPKEVASSLVQSFLKSGADARTKLDITIKPGGNLGDASSLRVFLLDYLGQIDRPAAGVIAMNVLSSYTTPDEWAVCLRNFAWANPDAGGHGYLQMKSRQLLENPEWRKNPSVGFLEAFDTIVYAHATDLTADLTAMVRDKENTAVGHAAYLTLDRLTIENPQAILSQLVQKPELMMGREQTRANFMARADLRQPEQRELVEQYLLDPDRTDQELNTFAALFPNGNYMVGDTMLTTTKGPAGGDLAASDRQSLRVIRQWENDPRFEPLLPVLAKMRERLESFVKHADPDR